VVYGFSGDKGGISSLLPCLHRFPYGSFKKMLEDPILKCHLRKLGPFFFGSQLAMVTIVLV